jgi:hypothetical protein
MIEKYSMAFENGPGSLADLLRDRRTVLRSASKIIGLVYYFLGLVLFSIGLGDAPVCPLMRGVTGLVDSFTGHFCLFYIIFCMLIPGMVIVCGEYSRTLHGYYSRWRDGGYLCLEGEDPEDTSNVSPGKRVRLILVYAWLSALAVTVIFFTGYTTRDYFPIVVVLWILAVIQTIFVRAMLDMYGKGE